VTVQQLAFLLKAKQLNRGEIGRYKLKYVK